MRAFYLAAVAVGALMTAPAAMAQDTTLVVSTNVASYCAISLANVAGSNVSVANGLRQKVTTMRLACNDPEGAILTTNNANGDLRGPPGPGSGGFQIINYDWELVVASPAASLGFAPADTFPGDGPTVTNAGYSEGLANGVSADFFLNLCYEAAGGSSGCGGADSEALSAPAGMYQETFTFDLNPA
jgi:hypothetical protein